MSEIEATMKLESLPNEIFIECFEYLNYVDIFSSFDQLNYRFNKLIRNIPKVLFDQFCKKLLSNREIKKQIHSLHLSNKETYPQIHLFLSLFSFTEFSHLHSLSLTQVDCQRLNYEY